MDHVTIGKRYNSGKIAYVKCVTNDQFEKIKIKNSCFLLIVLFKGTLSFQVDTEVITAAAPCFMCFDESCDPHIISRKKAEYYAIYFHPQFLNVNMSFELIRSGFYGDIAHTHDLFLLRPFINRQHVIPISESYIEKIDSACREMQRELTDQRDWYWSCRGRSYFMEIIIALERMYGLMGHGNALYPEDIGFLVADSKLRDVMLFIESHYADELTLTDIAKSGNLNHATLTRLMKQQTGCTVMEYLTNYRVSLAKKLLAFTEIPIKDISYRCGFKTVQHFSRVFKKKTDKTPADFRRSAVQKRKDQIK